MLWTISWFGTIFITSQNQFHELYSFTSQWTVHHVYDLPNLSPRLALTKFLLTSLIQYCIMSTMIVYTSSLMWRSNVQWFWRSYRQTWLFMCPTTHSATLRNGLYDDKRKVDVSNVFKSLLYFTRSVKWDIGYEDEPLFIKARNDLGLNEFKEIVCIVSTRCDIVCNDYFTTSCDHQR